MRKSLIMLVLVALVATPALAERTINFGWTGDADFLGCVGTALTAEADVAYNYDGQSAGNGLCLTKNSISPYANGYIATVWGLEEGDQVTATCWRYDLNTNMPHFALWAHYNDALEEAEDARGQDMSVDDGNMYGDQHIGNGGWEQYTHTWTIEAGHTGIVIDAQVYGPAGSQLYVDNLQLVIPDHASARTPGAVYASDGSFVAFESSTWTQVKSLFQ